MNVVRAVGIALAFVLLAGCAASPTLDRLRGAEPPLDPYYKEWHEEVNGTHEKRFTFPVTERSSEINVTVHLTPRASALDAAPARLTVQVLLPSGAPIANKTLDPTNRDFHLDTRDLVETGDYVIAIAGEGVSGGLQGQNYGAAYIVIVEVLQA